MVEEQVWKIYLCLLSNEIDQKLLINIDVIRRACRLPVVDTSQNDSGPDSVMILQIYDFTGGLSISKNFLWKDDIRYSNRE